MICKPCRDAEHWMCANALLLKPDRVGVAPDTGLWCYCQHESRDKP